MQITITGNLGSGKSTVCKYLSQKYGLEKYSTGDVQRALAKRMGMSTLELNLFMQQSPEYDRLIDDEVVKISADKHDAAIIFDSRMAWHFVKDSFKVFLLVDTQIAAERVFGDKRGDVEAYASLEDTRQKLKRRAASEGERFRTFYGVDYFNLANYDLVIDTAHRPSPDIAEVIYHEAVLSGATDGYQQKILLAPCSIFPVGACDTASAMRLAEELAIDNADSGPSYADLSFQVVRFRNYFFAAQESYKVLAAIMVGIPWVSVKVITDMGDDIERARDIVSVKRSNIAAFEAAGNFKYPVYPDFWSEA